ncbi:MAG TPA: YbaB/EbfC family nucleoid-associated protein [Elusimicrobiota bacterium]|nr:YbaB/EbfC family nucleoid-associated protein [Elusimicrobiota bacterium]
MFDKMKQLMELQKKAREMQAAMDALRVEKTGADGKIRLVMNGNFRVESISIDESFLSPSQKRPLEEALTRLVTETAEEIRQRSASQALGMMKGVL